MSDHRPFSYLEVGRTYCTVELKVPVPRMGAPGRAPGVPYSASCDTPVVGAEDATDGLSCGAGVTCEGFGTVAAIGAAARAGVGTAE